MSAVWLTVGPGTPPGFGGLGTALLFILIVSGVLNLLPDYLSLLETRALLRLMGGRAARIAAFLIVDAIATGLIFLTWWLLMFSFVVVLNLTEENWSQMWVRLPSLIWGMVTVDEQIGGGSIFFYSTFFTSVWLWLYALAYGAMLAARKVAPVIRLLQWLLPLETKPLRSLGIVSGGISCIGYWIFGFLLITLA